MTISQEKVDWDIPVETDAHRRARYAKSMKYWTAEELLEDGPVEEGLLSEVVNEEEVLLTCPHCAQWMIVSPEWFPAGSQPPRASLTCNCPYCFRLALKPDPPENLIKVVDKLRASD